MWTSDSRANLIRAKIASALRSAPQIRAVDSVQRPAACEAAAEEGAPAAELLGLKAELESSKKSLDLALLEQSSLRTQLEARDSAVAQLRAELEAEQRVQKELRASISRLNSTLEVQTETIEGQKSELAELNDKFGEAMEALREYARFARPEGSEKSLENDRDSADGEAFESPSARCRTLRETIDELEGEREQMVRIIQFFNDHSSEETLEKLKGVLEAEARNSDEIDQFSK